jgi:hypothetical protein
VTGASSAAIVDQIIRQRLEECPYRFYFNQITWTLTDGKLVLVGRVPSFYLKQILQTMLRDLDSVNQIENRVEVVSSTGLSSSDRE